MTSQPVIVLLEDERPQLLALRAALKGVGQIHEFSDPQFALAFVKEHVADAAIVDIHMPHLSTNGIDFIRCLRGFDQDLRVIIRTGDDSTELADNAIELRAFRRLIKGRVTTDELRATTEEAIAETRARRQATMDAAHAAQIRTELEKTLGSAEDERSVSDSYAALFQSLRNRLTVIAGVADLLAQSTAHGAPAEVVEEGISKNRVLVSSLLKDVDEFLDGPYAQNLRAARLPVRATVNGVLEAMKKRFQSAGRWIAARKYVRVQGLAQDMFVSTAPVKLITSLRHLLEFCLLKSQCGSVVELTAHCVPDGRSIISVGTDDLLLLSKSTLALSSPHIVFQCLAPIGDVPLSDIRRAFHDRPSDPREGNMQMIGLALAEENAAMSVQQSRQTTTFELALPVSR